MAPDRDPEAGGADPLDELYAAPLERFVQAREALTRRLRRAGDREAAERAAKLRKPSVAAWAVNQVALRHRDDIENLLRQGERLRNPENAREFREASRARQEAVAGLLDRAVAILLESGHGDSAAVRERITQTLLAGSADPETASVLERGRLERELEPADEWSVPVLAEAEAPQRDAASRRRQKAQRRSDELASQAEELEREARRLGDEADEAERTAARARRAAERALQRAADARRRAEDAREALAGLK